MTNKADIVDRHVGMNSAGAIAEIRRQVEALFSCVRQERAANIVRREKEPDGVSMDE